MKTHSSQVVFFFCRFKVEQKLDLRSTLQELGINSIFTNDADLSGMTGLCAQKHVSSVLEPNPQQPDSVDTSQSEKKSAEGGRRKEGGRREGGGREKGGKKDGGRREGG